MEFNKAYEYLKQYIGKNLSIKELKKIVNSTEQFDDRIFEGYNIVDCNILKCNYCFNGFINSFNESIYVDIIFTQKDNKTIQEMNYSNLEFENMIVQFEYVYIR